ncbi:hypothetical protein [Paenibacillus pabuli]|uniref:hypothetical protein n=1 Tax=Paenibacillus pabuli TaxID=1472 RepID=UPI001FFF5CED|nr:hypothetical protein [Paenibacillus pabuli]UPK42452.1 hypothetical protein KET34_25175 [Paenibacillus pabuli]
MNRVRVDFYYKVGQQLDLRPSSVIVEVEDITDEQKIIELAKTEARSLYGYTEIYKPSFALV